MGIQTWAPHLFELEEIITTESLSLLSGSHRCSSYYCHNGLQLEAENSHLLQFYYISDSSNFISASVHLSRACVRVGVCVCVFRGLTDLTDYCFIFELPFFNNHKFIISPSTSLLLNNSKFIPPPP